jgi:serine/threonine-protein kinase
MALSPDGRGVVYVAEHDGSAELYFLSVEGDVFESLEGTGGGFQPFFSPDGHRVGFFTEGELKKTSLGAGTTFVLADVDAPMGASWSADRFIYFAADRGATLYRIPEEGGEPEALASGKSYLWPEPLEGRDTVLVSRLGGGIALVSTRTGEERELLDQGRHPRRLPTGDLVYTLPGKLMVVAFDDAQLRLEDAPVVFLDGVRTELYGAAHWGVADDGPLVYLPGPAAEDGSLVQVDRDGSVESLLLPTEAYGTFRLSPDGSQLAAEIQDGSHDIWIFDLLSPSRRRMTFDGDNGFPLWSPDGRWVAYVSNRSEQWNLYRRRADGSGNAERLTRSSERQVPFSWSPDGKWLAFTKYSRKGRGDIWLLPLTPGATPEPFRESPFHESVPVFSPDGRSIAYVSDESGQPEIYVEGWPRSGERQRISVRGGEEPSWSPRGDELLYREGNRWMVVPLQTGKPVLLFEGDYVHPFGRSYDVAPDGRKLLLVQRQVTPPSGELRLVRKALARPRERVSATPSSRIEQMPKGRRK